MTTAIRANQQDLIRPDKDSRFLGEENPFEAMMSRFDYAAQRLSLDPGHYKVLRSPEKQIIVSIPFLRDNGEVEVYTGYRVLYNTSRGPADRESTRLNSSHVEISYAVFCLKKKKK